MLFGIVDVMSFLLIVLPLYPNVVGDYIYSVNLLNYSQASMFNRGIYWSMYIALMAIGLLKILLAEMRIEKYNKLSTGFSVVVSILLIIFLALTREAYAIVVAFLLLVIKGLLVIRCIKR